jgi:Fe-S-cluster containining protein
MAALFIPSISKKNSRLFIMTKYIELLNNYRQLVGRIDSLCAEIHRAYSGSIACRKGCNSCCRHFSVFWVEAVTLALAARSLPKEQLALLRNRAKSFTVQDICPLQEDGACILYAHRPIICRTHGLPILMRRGADVRVDYCPRNFANIETFSGNAILDLDRLNEILAAINLLFVSRYFDGKEPPTTRVTISEALMMEI